MANVNLQLRGGPYDGQTVGWDVPDPDDPPRSYELKLHGPHEATETFEYQRAGRAPGAADGSWIYESTE